MTFQEAIKILNIEDYGDRICNSNSHGELFHLNDYVVIAGFLNAHPDSKVSFREWFERVVAKAELTWKRPLEASELVQMEKYLSNNYCI